MKKKIYIHVGPGKTGSSAIQAWLHDNNKILKKTGIYYPQHQISSNGISSGNRDALLSCEEEVNWYLDKEKVSALLKKFETSPFHTLLLSSEFFALFIVEIAELIPTAQFVFYLRNPLELIESSYNQGIKREGGKQLFVTNQQLHSRVGQLDQLISRLGKERFIVKSYDLAKSHSNGGLVGDFISFFNITERVENKTINPSYCLEVLEFKRLLNFFEISALHQKLDTLLQDYRIGTQNYSLIPPEQFQRLKQFVCEEMESLTAKYQLPELELVIEHYNKVTQRPYKKQQISLEQVKEILAYFEKVDPKFFDELKQTIIIQPYYKLENKQIYQAFDIEPQALTVEPLSDDKLDKVFKGLNLKNKDKLVIDLANYYKDKRDINNAKLLYSYALSLKPDSIDIYNKLVGLKYFPIAEKKRLANQHKLVRLKRFLKSLLPSILTQNS